MELQEFSLIGLIGQLRFALNPKYPDVRGEIITDMVSRLDLPHWGWGDEVINFHNEDRTWTLLAGGREARGVFFRIEEVAEIVGVATELFEATLSHLQVTEVNFVGARTYWGAAVDSFDELRDYVIQDIGTSKFGDLIAATGTPASDVGFVVECHSQDPKHTFRFGPMTRAQAASVYMPDAPQEDLPENFLFLDLDRNYNEKTFPADEAITQWQRNIERNLEIAGEIGKMLTGVSAVR